jgi:hypothetical protein
MRRRRRNTVESESENEKRRQQNEAQQRYLPVIGRCGVRGLGRLLRPMASSLLLYVLSLLSARTQSHVRRLRVPKELGHVVASRIRQQHHHALAGRLWSLRNLQRRDHRRPTRSTCCRSCRPSSALPLLHTTKSACERTAQQALLANQPPRHQQRICQHTIRVRDSLTTLRRDIRVGVPLSFVLIHSSTTDRSSTSGTKS